MFTKLKCLIETVVEETLKEALSSSPNKNINDIPTFEDWIKHSYGDQVGENLSSLRFYEDDYENEKAIEELEEKFDYWENYYTGKPDPMTIYRCISVPDVSAIEYNGIGKFWADFSSANSCYLKKESGNPNFIVAAKVYRKSIDWMATLSANLSTFEEEREITLNSGSKVKILYVEDEEGNRYKPTQNIAIV